MKPNRLKQNNKHTDHTGWGGALIFAMGFSVLIAVGTFGYFKYFIPQKLQTRTVSIQTPAHNPREIMRQKIQDKLPTAKDEMLHPDPQSLYGRWLVKFGKSSMAELILLKEKFELIYVVSPNSPLRKYSKGKYNYDQNNGKMTLYPDRQAPQPEAIPGVEYEILTTRYYDIDIYTKPDEKALYFIAPEKDIPAKTYHPLFSYADFKGAPVLKFSPVNN